MQHCHTRRTSHVPVEHVLAVRSEAMVGPCDARVYPCVRYGRRLDDDESVPAPSRPTYSHARQHGVLVHSREEALPLCASG